MSSPNADAPKIDPTKTHVRCWSTSTTGRSTPAGSIRIGRYVFFGAEDNLVHRFDLDDENARRRWPPTIAGCGAIGCSPSGDVLYTGGYDGRLDLVAGRRRRSPSRSAWSRPIKAGFAPWRSAPTASASPPAATTTSSSCGTPPTASSSRELAGHASHVYNVAFHPSGETLVSLRPEGRPQGVGPGRRHAEARPGRGCRPLQVRHHVPGRHRRRAEHRLPHRRQRSSPSAASPTSPTPSPASATPRSCWSTWPRARPALQLEAKEKINGVAWGVAHHPEGFWIGLAGGGGGGWLYFWKGDAANEFFKLKLPNDGRGLAVSPGGDRVAVAHADGNLRIFALHEKS